MGQHRGTAGIRAGAGALALAVWLGPAGALAEVVGRISVSSDGTQANGASSSPAISADGRFVVFVSEATNLVVGDGNGFADVFVHDRLTGATSRVSVGFGGAEANGASRTPSINADGRLVAFQSDAVNLTADEFVGPGEIYVFDRGTATTSRACLTNIGGGPNDLCFTPVLSGDGRSVAFASLASNLVVLPGTTFGQKNVYVRNLTTGGVTVTSVSPGGTDDGDGDSDQPAISHDGRIVAFRSAATNLVADDANFALDVFVRDRGMGVTTRASVDSSNTEATGGNSQTPAVSADGRFVAFASDAANLVTGDTNAQTDVFVRDLTGGTTSRVSLSSAGVAGNGASLAPSLSADGRFVAFQSFATNLASPCTNGLGQIFVRDRVAGTTICVSVNGSGIQGSGPSGAPRISADGRFVAFESTASNLFPGDTNGVSDVFVSRVAVGPNWLVASAASGSTAVHGFDALGNPTPLTLDPGFTGGAHVALGDVNGDGAAELIVGAGAGSSVGPHVRIYAGSAPTAANLLVDFDANSGAPGGINVAACDLDGQGRAHIITGPGPGGGALVRVWAFDAGPPAAVTPLASFQAYGASPGGVFVACGRLDGAGSAPSIITGPGPGSPPLVRVFTANLPGGTATERLEFLAYPASFTGGVSVAAGDVRGQGRAAIVTGPGPGFAPLVRVWTIGPPPNGATPVGPRQSGEFASDEASFTVGDPSSTAGVNVAAGETDGTGGDIVVAGSGPGAPPQVTTINAQSDAPQPQQAITPPQGTGGVVPAAPPGTTAAAPEPFKPLRVKPTPTGLQAGDAFRVDVVATNPGPAVTADVFLGILLPPAVGPALGCPGGDALALVASEGLIFTCLSAPQTFRPLLHAVTVPAGLPPVTFPDLFTTVIPPGAPAGNYLAALALTEPGTLNFVQLAGTLAFTTAGFAIVP